MGGGGHGHADAGHGHGAGDFRNKVWSMTGGPYCRPVHWRRNTAIALFGIVLVCIPIAMKSAELEYQTGNVSSSIKLVLVCHRIFALLSKELACISSYKLQRPHEPVRPIPSQLWCKNFGKKEY